MLPVLEWARAYDRRWLLADALAGVAVWAVVVPEAVAYAQIAGLPPQAALAPAPIALVVYALLGSSRGVIVGATTASAVVVGSTISPLASGDPSRRMALAAALTLLIGVTALVLGLARMGWVSQFLSRPVMTGFVFGLGLVVMAGQLPSLLGIPGSSGGFFQRVADLARHVDASSGVTLAVGAGALALLVALDRLAPQVPGALVVVVAGIALTAALGLDGHGVAVVGSIPAGIPVPQLPGGLAWGDVGALVPGALAVCLIAYSEQLAAARYIGGSTDADQELLALGAANAAAGLVRGLAVGGGLSKTAVSARAGARTQVSSLSAAVLALITVVAFTGVFRDLPAAVLGAVVVHAVAGLIRADAMLRYWRVRRVDFLLAATALLGVLVLDVLPGLLLAVGLSLAYLIFRASRPHTAVLGRLPRTTTFADVLRHPEAKTYPGLVILRPDAEVFFANASLLRHDMLHAARSARPQARALVCDLEATSDIDVDGVDMLDEAATQLLSTLDCRLHLARVRDPVQDVLRRAGSSLVAEAHCHRTVQDAVDAALADIRAYSRR